MLQAQESIGGISGGVIFISAILGDLKIAILHVMVPYCMHMATSKYMVRFCSRLEVTYN